MKLEEYKTDEWEEIGGLLDGHEDITPSTAFTARVMHAVKREEELTYKQSTTGSFQMKLASSLICSGLLLLLNNMTGLSRDVDFIRGMHSLGNILSEAVNKLQ